MKFILEEPKFKLNEKFTLAEKFILNEASEDLNLILEDPFTELSKVLKEKLENNNIITKFNNLLASQLIQNANSDLKDNIKNFDKNFFTDLLDDIKTLKELNISSKAPRKNLKNSIKKAEQEKIKLDSLLEDIKEEGTTVKKLIDNFKITTDELEKTLLEISETKPLTKEHLEILNQLKEQLTNLNDELPKYIDSCNSTKQKINEVVKSDKHSDPKAKKEWKQLLTNASKEPNATEQMRSIWKDYFKTEWGDNAEKIEKLGYVFQEELLELGFNESTNPFITFVKNHIDNLSVDNYPAFHNAYIRRNITKNDLISKSVNILNTEDLYNKSANDILQYLALQNKIRFTYQSADTRNKFANEEVAKTYWGEGQKAEVTKFNQFIIAVFNSVGNPLKLNTYKDPIRSCNLMNLKTVDGAKDSFTSSFSEGAVTTAPEKTTWDSNTKNAFSGLIRTKTDAINVIKYLLAISNSNWDLVKQYPEIVNSGSTFDLKQIQKWSSQFNNVKVDKKSIEKIIKDIAELGHLTLNK